MERNLHALLRIGNSQDLQRLFGKHDLRLFFGITSLNLCIGWTKQTIPCIRICPSDRTGRGLFPLCTGILFCGLRHSHGKTSARLFYIILGFKCCILGRSAVFHNSGRSRSILPYYTQLFRTDLSPGNTEHHCQGDNAQNHRQKKDPISSFRRSGK